MREYDTQEYRSARNAAKVERRARLAWMKTYDHMLGSTHEIYIKSDKGDLTKAETVVGTRAMQVAVRREVRARMKMDSTRVLLFTNGKLVKLGVDGAKK